MTARQRQSCAAEVVSSEFDQSPIDFHGKSPLLTRAPVAKVKRSFHINVLGISVQNKKLLIKPLNSHTQLDGVEMADWMRQ